MKILVVHNAYQSHTIGGEDVVVKHEIRGLKNTLGTENVFEYIVSNNDIRPLKLAFTLWGSKHYYQEIIDLVRAHQIDIVHIHNFFPLLTPSIFKAASDAGAVVVHTLHNYRWWCLAGVFYRKDKGICEECVNKKIAYPGILHQCYRQSTVQSTASALAFAWYQIKDYQQYIDAYFVLSDFQKTKLNHLIAWEKMKVKPNPIDFPTTWKPVKEKQHYLFVGRLESAKGIELLLSTWVQLPSHFHLEIIGEGTAHWQQKYARSHIHFLGTVPHSQVLSKMAEAKYLVHTSLAYETFGLTIIEAMSQATPVIGMDSGPRAELIHHAKNGFLCQVENLKETILRSLDYPHYEMLSQNALQSAKMFDGKVVIQKQIDIYHQLMKGKAA